MKGTVGRLARLLAGNLVKILSLLLAVSLIAFVLVTASPVDPVQQYILGLGTAVSPEQRAQIEAYWGVDQPPVQRYLSWLSSVLHGDLGVSSLYRRPVAEILAERFGNSLALMVSAWVLSGLLGFGVGCAMGLFRDRWPDRLLKKVCYVPSPIGLTQAEVTLGQRIYHLILPAVTLSFLSFSNIALHTRQKVIDVENSEYALFARARGEGALTRLFRHDLRNVLLPALTLQFSSFAELFGGSVLAENVFSYPGLGSAAAAAGLGGDVPLLLGITLFSALFVCAGNLIANLLYGVVDPRIREVEA